MANTTFDKSRLLRVVDEMASNIDWLLQPWLWVFTLGWQRHWLAVGRQIARQVPERIEAIANSRSVIPPPTWHRCHTFLGKSTRGSPLVHGPRRVQLSAC